VVGAVLLGLANLQEEGVLIAVVLNHSIVDRRSHPGNSQQSRQRLIFIDLFIAHYQVTPLWQGYSKTIVNSRPTYGRCWSADRPYQAPSADRTLLCAIAAG